MKHGDFTELAEDYANNRAAYSPLVRDALMALPQRKFSDLEVADIGAGTGIWTRMMADAKLASIVGVEPNIAMRALGESNIEFPAIQWKAGRGETSGLNDDSLDLVTMASSFHWTETKLALQEFARILRPGGWFAALWNTRYLQANPMLVEIEAEIQKIVPELERISSGRSQFTENLPQIFYNNPQFEGTLYIEGFHVEKLSRERYIGLWHSVNDIQVQAGPDRFAQFIQFVEKRLAQEPVVEATYQTRAWAARRKK